MSIQFAAAITCMLPKPKLDGHLIVGLAPETSASHRMIWSDKNKIE
jgi:hypothetical protein